MDLKRFIDHKKNVVHSVTGQITWNYGEGICTIDAPQAQGASGFLKKTSPIKLKDVTIQSSNDYATVTGRLARQPALEREQAGAGAGRHDRAAHRLDRARDDVSGR